MNPRSLGTLALLCMAGSTIAQTGACEVPPGTIALGRYCARAVLPAVPVIALAVPQPVPAQATTTAAQAPLPPAPVTAPSPAPEPALASAVPSPAPVTAPVPPAEPPAPSMRADRVIGVVERGHRARTAALTTEGRDVPLRDAVRAIVPVAYSVRPTACVALQTPVTWRRSGDWIDALDQLAASQELKAIVDHDMAEVLIDRPPQVSPEAARTWSVLRSDGSLRRSLERWTAPACVQLEWDVPWPLEVSADRLYPDMPLWDALRQLAADLETSETPILITRHANAVRITAGHQR